MDKNLRYITNRLALTVIMIFSVLSFTSCAEDDVVDNGPTEYDILGVWQDSDSHILDIANPDRMYEYRFYSVEPEYPGEEKMEFWTKHRQMYFFEPLSSLIMYADEEGAMQLYKMISVDDDTLVLCWVAPVVVSGGEGDEKFQVFSVFFKDDYVVDRANDIVFKRLTEQQLDKALEGYELIDLDEVTTE